MYSQMGTHGYLIFFCLVPKDKYSYLSAKIDFVQVHSIGIDIPNMKDMDTFHSVKYELSHNRV